MNNISKLSRIALAIDRKSHR